MTVLWRRFCSLHLLVRIIWFFCAWGLVANAIAVGHDLTHHGILFRLHVGFLLLYCGQVISILVKERLVWVLSLLQLVLAFMTNLDFTFVPPLRWVGGAIYAVWGPFSLDAMDVYKYVFVSVCFSLEGLKTFLLWRLIPPHAVQIQKNETADS